jgi:hypothetical protein
MLRCVGGACRPSAGLLMGDIAKFGVFMVTLMMLLDYVALPHIPASANLEGKVAIVTGVPLPASSCLFLPLLPVSQGPCYNAS